jgi:endo-1,4-beta-xylanase
MMVGEMLCMFEMVRQIVHKKRHLILRTFIIGIMILGFFLGFRPEIAISEYQDSKITERKRAGLEFLYYPHEWQKEEPLQVYTNLPERGPFNKAISDDGLIRIDVPEKFSLTVNWYTDKHGYLWLTADNEGKFYDLSMKPQRFHLNYELAESRVVHNRHTWKRYREKGLNLKPNAVALHRQSEKFLQLAKSEEGESRARLSDLSLVNAIEFSGELEIAWSFLQQKKPGFKPPLFGVDSRHYFWTNIDNLNKYFPQLFDYATITHYLTDSWFPPFEPNEGDLRWGAKEDIFAWLNGYGTVVQARPILWFHEGVTPEWLRKKNFEEVKEYARVHAKSLVEHWGNRITRWEVANEMHDWANVLNLSPAQITEVIKITSQTVRELQPHATLIINNTSIFGDYAALETAPGESPSRRTPYLFIKDLIEADVDFDVIGLQLYEPMRDLSELVRLIEKFEAFNKEIMISEMGVPSYYEDDEFLASGQTRWSETLQAKWAENVFRVLGVRPSVRVICWYDLTDFRSFVNNGGVLTDDGLPKEVFAHLKQLKEEWQRVSEVGRSLKKQERMLGN